jgi:hypothetical protein
LLAQETVTADQFPAIRSFNAREDLLHGLTVGSKVNVGRAGAPEPSPALVTEVVHRSFATWQAERAIGDHDRSTLRLRLDPLGDPAGPQLGPLNAPRESSLRRVAITPPLTISRSSRNEFGCGYVSRNLSSDLLCAGVRGKNGWGGAIGPENFSGWNLCVRAAVEFQAQPA